LVSKDNGAAWRLIFDARYINEYITCPAFKYEDLSLVPDILQQHDFMFTTDFSRGYHHVDVHPAFHQFLGFQWQGKYYMYTQLPFGLNVACWAFSRITREVLRHFRTHGQKCSGYLDDMLFAKQHEGDLHAARPGILQLLKDLGFLLNLKKCQPVAQRVKYLGLIIDTLTGTFWVPACKMAALFAALKALLSSPRTTPMAVASLVGTLGSMRLALGRMVHLGTFHLQHLISTYTRGSRGWKAHIAITPLAREELSYWQANVHALNGGGKLWQPCFSHSLELQTDAAGQCKVTFGGWAGYTFLNGSKIFAQGRFSEQDSVGTSSTFIELLAICLSLDSFTQAGHLVGQNLVVKTDSQAAAAVLNKGHSMAPQIHSITLRLFRLCSEQGLHLRGVWVPREENQLADYLSKLHDAADWSLSPSAFQQVTARWGTLALDLFSSTHNNLLPRFFTQHHSPGTAGVDAFQQSWPSRSWAHPPPSLIPRILQQAKLCRASCCLLVPYWPGCPWWPLLAQQGAFLNFVVDWLFLPWNPSLFLLGPGYKNQGNAPRWDALILFLDNQHPSPSPLPLPCPQIRRS
jgi:hypothetical protein